MAVAADCWDGLVDEGHPESNKDQPDLFSCAPYLRVIPTVTICLLRVNTVRLVVRSSTAYLHYTASRNHYGDVLWALLDCSGAETYALE
jgi:hypothetical protein